MINIVTDICIEYYVEKKVFHRMKFQDKNQRKQISAGLRGQLRKGKFHSIYISMKIK